MSVILSCLVAEGCLEGVSCENVPVENNVNRFLLQEAISILFHESGVAIHSSQ